MSNEFGIKVTWTPFTDDGARYLREEIDGSRGCTIWGPIPDEIKIPDLIDERAAQLKAMADRQLVRAVEHMRNIELDKFVGDGCKPSWM